MTDSLDSKNSNFWMELCGTNLAKSLGITDFSEMSLNKFDDYYMAYYPFLEKYLHLAQVENKDVLEIGLGYGTVSSLLIKARANYIGLDIAEGPVDVVNLRTSYITNKLSAKTHHGTALNNSLPDASLDFVIAIGSLHHTGDLKKAIAECYRVLRPGGKLCFMVYYSYSYRRVFTHFADTIKYAVRELFGYRGVVPSTSTVRSRGDYDANSDGESAPHTDWISKRSLKYLCRNFSKVHMTVENIDTGKPFDKSMKTRDDLLNSLHPRIWGLDLYCIATK